MMICSMARIEDLDLIDVQAEQSSELYNLGQAINLMLQNSMRTVTIRDGEDVLAIMGLIESIPGCGHAWAVVSDSLQNRGLALTATVRDLMQACRTELKLRRIDMMVLASCRRHIAWALRLGFEEEGVARNYGHNGEDYLYMSRVWQ